MIPLAHRNHRLFKAFSGVVCVLALSGAALAVEREGVHQTSLAGTFFVQRDANTGNIELIGSVLVWMLIALSIACTAMITALAWENRRVNILPPNLPERMRRLIRERHLKQAMDELHTSGGSFFASVLHSALAESANGTESMLRAAEATAEEIAGRRLRRLEPLSVLGNVAPMIGLFGTVYGIILAFREIVASGGTPDPVSLAAGIGTALVATFWGLVVAIPALSAYGLIRNAIDGQTVEACRVVEQLVTEARPGAVPAAPMATHAPVGVGAR